MTKTLFRLITPYLRFVALGADAYGQKFASKDTDVLSQAKNLFAQRESINAFHNQSTGRVLCADGRSHGSGPEPGLPLKLRLEADSCK